MNNKTSYCVPSRDCCDQKPPPESGPVNERIAKLSNAIDEVEKSFTHMANRIESVLAPDSPGEPCPCSPEPACRCELERRISEMTDRVDLIASEIQRVRSRVQL